MLKNKRIQAQIMLALCLLFIKDFSAYKKGIEKSGDMLTTF